MRAVVQRVKTAFVSVNEAQVARIGKGFLVFLGIEADDKDSDSQYICDKLLGLRIFEDEQGKMNLSIEEVSGEILLVSQFTLLADARKGRRPSFINAARPEYAYPIYNKITEALNIRVPTQTGVFQADMDVGLVNDGPVTILLDSRRLF